MNLPPRGIVFFAEGPHPPLIHVVDEGLAAARDDAQQGGIVVVRVLGVFQGPGGGQREEAVLVLADPGFIAETPRLGIILLEDVGNVAHQRGDEVVPRRPFVKCAGPERRTWNRNENKNVQSRVHERRPFACRCGPSGNAWHLPE